MEWIAALRGATVALDTAPLIYYIEEHPIYLRKLQAFFEAAERGQFRVITSCVTLVEVLVQPLRNGREDLAQQYRGILLRSSNLRSLPLNEQIAEAAARLRATYNLRTPDAIQLATAKVAGASWFLTNDLALPALPGLRLLVVDSLSAQ